MAPSSGTASTGGKLRDRRSSKIKSSSASVPPGLCTVLRGCSAMRATVSLKQNKKIRILTSGALSSLTCVHHTTIPLKDSPTFGRRKSSGSHPDFPPEPPKYPSLKRCIRPDHGLQNLALIFN